MVGSRNCKKNLQIFFAMFLQFVVSTDECAKILQKIVAKFLQFELTTISEKNIMHFNFKAIYAWHFYGTRRGFFNSVTSLSVNVQLLLNLNML